MEMGAKFNIVIFTRNVISLNWLFEVVQTMGINVTLKEIIFVENWEFENLQIHACESDTNQVYELLKEGRIISISGDVNSNNFVLMLSKEENIYETSISLDTKNLVYLDSDIIDETTQPFYDGVSRILLSPEMVNDLLISALGVEVIVDYSDDLEKINLKSYNVMRWVLGIQKSRTNHNLKGYRQISANIWDKVT
jgi:hypothetical protein